MAITKVEDSQVKIRNVDFTQSVFWARLANDCTAKIALDIPDGKLYTIKALYKDASVEIPAPKTEDTTKEDSSEGTPTSGSSESGGTSIKESSTTESTKSEDDYYEDITSLLKDAEHSSKVVDFTKPTDIKLISLSLNNDKLSSKNNGVNTLKLIVKDVTPATGTTGVSTYTYDLTVETRNSFKINRNFNYKSEYLISGSGNITNDNGFFVNTNNGSLKSLAIPRKAIEMDGRATIRGIKVTADSDSSGECHTDFIVQTTSDEGDYNVQNIPFVGALAFTSIDKIQAINANDANK